MAKIRLFNRTEVGPTRSGVAKPGFDLARGSGLSGIGAAISKFSGAIFDDLVATKAANEEAAFQGQVNTGIQAFETTVAANPGWGYDKLEKERAKMMTTLDKASQTATTLTARRNNKNFMLRNKDYLLARTQTTMESIRVKQELLASQSHIKNLMNNFNRAGLREHYDDMVESGLYNPDVIFGPVDEKTRERIGGVFDNQIAIIDEAEKKVLMDQLKTGIESKAFKLAAESGLDAAEDFLRDPEITAQFIDAGMTREDARSLLNDVSERVKHEKVQADEKIEAQREVDRGDIYNAINVGVAKLPDGTETTDLRKYIESTSLDEDEQESMWQKAIAETDRKLKGLDIITDSRVRSQFYKEIPLMLSGAVTRDELLDRANNARFGEMADGILLEPTLNEKDYAPLVNAINAQYEQGYGQMMSKVTDYAEGILLQPDRFGIVDKPQVRYGIYADFQEAWFAFVAEKGDKLKIADIYPEGRRLAASFILSQSKLLKREDALREGLEAREAGIEGRTEGETIQDYLKRIDK